MKNKFGVVCLVLAIIIMLGGVGTSITFAYRSFNEMKGITAYIDEQKKLKAEEGITKENDVKIAESYEIKSTEAISDAYKSGDNSKLDDKQKETLQMASDILKEIITDGMSDYEKEIAVYDWMCKNLASDANLLVVIPANAGQEADNPYGVLKYHSAVCVGYATTFRLFMQMLDIECMVVHNTECYHSWDLVKIDGDWYHTDIYGDVGKGDYSNFNLCDAIRSQQQTWDTTFFPHANSVKRNKAMENISEVASIEELPALYAQNITDKKYSFFVRFNANVDEEFARRAQAVTYMFNTAIDSMYIPDGGIWLQTQCWLPDDNGFVYYISFYHYGNDDTTENALTEEEKEQLNEVISDVISKLYEQYYNDNSGENEE
ncbi:MAG: hypothetical protein K6E39_00245 [Lachnospiraceae bacterium]|nr:hypothetical protein [Lachnospiraceae bacterium]